MEEHECRGITFATSTKFSPSARLVLKALQINGWMTQREIVKETSLPPRTVKYAIKKLKEGNIIQEKPSLDDMRQKYYSIVHESKVCTEKEVYKNQILMT